jgi:hypothetical protein
MIDILEKQLLGGELTKEMVVDQVNNSIGQINDIAPGILGSFEGFPGPGQIDQKVKQHYFDKIDALEAAKHIPGDAAPGTKAKQDNYKWAVDKRFADGGIVTQQFRGMVSMAERGVPEVVAPLDKLEEVMQQFNMAGGGGGGTTINFSPVIQAMDMSGANDAMDRFLNDKMIPAIRDASREGTVVINEDGIEKSPTA